MDSIVCNKCETENSVVASFCLSCGNGLTCKKCSTILQKDARFCTSCGSSVSQDNVSVANNSLIFRKTKEETYCNFNFTNEVGKEGIQSLISNLTGSSKIIDVSDNIDITESEIKSQRLGESSQQKSDDEKTIDASKHGNYYPKSMEDVEIPHIDDLIHIKFSELQWILIHAFYLSEKGKIAIKSDDIRKSYLDKRRTKGNASNFSGYLKSFKGNYLNTVTDGVYKFNPLKIQAIIDLVNGVVSPSAFLTSPIRPNRSNKNKATNASEEAKPTTSSKTKTAKSAGKIDIEVFDVLKNSDKPSLEEFFNKCQPTGNNNIIGIIAYYIIIYNKKDVFTLGQLDYAFKILKIPRKNNLRQIVTNMKNDTHWLSTAGSGSWKLERLGETKLEEIFGIS